MNLLDSNDRRKLLDEHGLYQYHYELVPDNVFPLESEEDTEYFPNAFNAAFFNRTVETVTHLAANLNFDFEFPTVGLACGEMEIDTFRIADAGYYKKQPSECVLAIGGEIEVAHECMKRADGTPKPKKTGHVLFTFSENKGPILNPIIVIGCHVHLKDILYDSCEGAGCSAFVADTKLFHDTEKLRNIIQVFANAAYRAAKENLEEAIEDRVYCESDDDEDDEYDEDDEEDTQ